MSSKPHISVCICTYKRPELLKELLWSMEGLYTGGLFDYSVVIVDNDGAESARQVVRSCAAQSRIQISYHVEPEQNISLARNRAVDNATGEIVGFIDDDEFPSDCWLLELYRTLRHFSADGVMGPVLPHFDTEPPDWVRKGGFFDRPHHRTGEILQWKNTRTGNVLLKKEVFPEGEVWFDPAYGSGGEDRDFFRRKIREGCVFIWCEEAPVYETVPSARWKRTVLLKRALLRGKMALNAPGSKAASLVKSSIAVVTYTLCLPVFLVMGQHVLMKYLIKICDHLGKLTAFMGFDLVKEKYVSG